MNRSLVSKAVMVAALSLGAVAVSGTTARAQDQVNFNGAARVANGSDINYLSIDFLTGNMTGMGIPGTITATQTADGVFAAGVIPGVTMGTISDITLSRSGVVNAPIDPFVTLGAYTFSLTSTPLAGGPTPPNFGPVQLTQLGGNTSAAFAVDGYVTAGPDAVGRAYTGIFTAQFAGQTPEQVFNSVNNGSSLPVSFSANFALSPASTVPEPSTYALFATGLGELGAAARRRRQQA